MQPVGSGKHKRRSAQAVETAYFGRGVKLQVFPLLRFRVGIISRVYQEVRDKIKQREKLDMSRVIAIIERRRLDFYLAFRIGIIGRFSDAGRIVVAAMAVLCRVVIPVRSIMIVVIVMMILIVILMMRHMKTDCPVIVMMMRYRSRHQHDKYRYYNG